MTTKRLYELARSTASRIWLAAVDRKYADPSDENIEKERQAYAELDEIEKALKALEA